LGGSLLVLPSEPALGRCSFAFAPVLQRVQRLPLLVKAWHLRQCFRATSVGLVVATT